MVGTDLPLFVLFPVQSCVGSSLANYQRGQTEKKIQSRTRWNEYMFRSAEDQIPDLDFFGGGCEVFAGITFTFRETRVAFTPKNLLQFQTFSEEIKVKEENELGSVSGSILFLYVWSVRG